MAIELVCGGCGKRIRAVDAAAGKRIKCPKCQWPIDVPEAEPAPAFAPQPAEIVQATFVPAPPGPERPEPPADEPEPAPRPFEPTQFLPEPRHRGLWFTGRLLVVIAALCVLGGAVTLNMAAFLGGLAVGAFGDFLSLAIDCETHLRTIREMCERQDAREQRLDHASRNSG